MDQEGEVTIDPSAIVLIRWKCWLTPMSKKHWITGINKQSCSGATAAGCTVRLLLAITETGLALQLLQQMPSNPDSSYAKNPQLSFESLKQCTGVLLSAFLEQKIPRLLGKCLELSVLLIFILN